MAVQAGRWRRGISGLFRRWEVIASVMMAFALIALAARTGEIAWPSVLATALADYHALIDFVFGLVVPSRWPSWTSDLLMAYIWGAIALYVGGFAQWGPDERPTTASKIKWWAVDVGAAIIWPISLLGALVASVIATWILYRTLAIFGLTLIMLWQALSGRLTADSVTPPATRSMASFILPAARVVLTAFVKQFVVVVLVFVAFLATNAVLDAATSDLPSVSQEPGNLSAINLESTRPI